MPEGKYFFIRSQLNGKVLDIYENDLKPDQFVRMYDAKSEDADNQLWFCHPLTKTIRSKKDPDYCLDLNDNELVVNPYSDKDTQKWKLSGDRVVRVSNPGSVLDILENNSEDGAKVGNYDFHGGDNQLWEFDCQQPQYFFIRSALNGKVMDIFEANPDEGSHVLVYGQKETADDNQLWYEDKHGYIRSKLNNMVLDGSGEDLTMHTHDTGSDRQRWSFDGDKIMNVDRPEEALDIKGGCPDDGACLIPWQLHGGENQCWSRDYI